ncbi:hypothetical protein [Nocardia sp. NPDC056000]|uniref:hypothetical protein n=1 Tax=Nocardia sp. NPDC056000 TaxID=3345674 RepID=UPI0035E2AAC2
MTLPAIYTRWVTRKKNAPPSSSSGVVAEPEAAAGRWEADLRTYLNHERIKSVIVDTVRYAKVLVEEAEPPIKSGRW